MDIHFAHKQGATDTIQVTTYCARSLLEEFLRAHGVDLDRYPMPTTVTIDSGQVTYEQYVFDSNGEPVDGGDDIKRELVTVPQRAPWPLDTNLYYNGDHQWLGPDGLTKRLR